ncbi:MAG: tellurium resistance protein [Rhodobacteraceae bacterium]|nr:tellurium resistance protein [Paracoccaceae bacterium]
MKFKAPNPTPRGLCRRVPPAIFPPIMGLFGLGLAWRRAAGSYALPQALPDAILGAVTLLFLFAFGAYAIKVLRRPAVVAEEVRILPGRAGLAAAVLSIYLMSMAIFPFGAGLSRVVLFAGFGLHAALVLILLVQLARGPAEQRRVTPVWHLNYVGFIIGALAGTLHAYYMPAFGIFLASALIAALIWAVSLEQLVKEDVPAPLRPLLAIHLAPVALLGLVAAALELEAVSMGAAGVAALLLGWFVARGRWMTAAGFSPLWGAFTFPLAATASLWLTVGGGWRYPGTVVLVAATFVIPYIAFRILKTWATGALAIKTNAAAA